MSERDGAGECAAVQLGDALDLWAGLKAAFPSTEIPWQSVPGRPTRTERFHLPSDRASWRKPTLSFHEDVDDLLSHIFDYSVVPMPGLDGPLQVTAGGLMTPFSLRNLEKRLCMDLTVRPAPAHLLLRIAGPRATGYYAPEWQGANRKTRIEEWLTPEGRAAMARLRVSMRRCGSEFHGDVTARQAQRYIDYFAEMGTHVVRSLTCGGLLFQVFEVNADLLGSLRGIFGSTGRGGTILAQGMDHLACEPWVRRASPILSADEGTQAEQVCRSEIWLSGKNGASSARLSPKVMSSGGYSAVLDMLPASSIIGASFASQALYLEDYRADAWARIMRAGLNRRFSGIRSTGWRKRTSHPVGSFLGSAGLVGDEALCKVADGMLPPLVLSLDVRKPARVALPRENCLVLFAGTDPHDGAPAELELDGDCFDPSRLAIAFVDGAICVTDAGGLRSCLVEGLWLHSSNAGRPDAPLPASSPDAVVLAEHQPLLISYARLMGLLQGEGFPQEIARAMGRASLWLAKAAASDGRLGALRWNAIQSARGAGCMDARSLTLDRARNGELARLLEVCIDLLAMPAHGTMLEQAVRATGRKFEAFYRALLQRQDLSELDRRCRVAGENVHRCLVGLGQTRGLPPTACALLIQGTNLSMPPEEEVLPHRLLADGHAEADVANAVLALRSCYTESRAIVMAMQEGEGVAADLLEREILDCGAGPENPALHLLAALEELCESHAEIDTNARTLLIGETGELMALRGQLRILHRSRLMSEGADRDGPQLSRLLLMLEALDICRAVGIAPVPLDNLAPSVMAARIEGILSEVTARHQCA